MNTTPQNRSVAIHVSDLHQSYGSFEAVRGVSFTVAPGELFALLGTNGAGKTTTIETLEGFRRPTRGTVRIFGIDPFGQPPELRPGSTRSSSTADCSKSSPSRKASNWPGT